VIIALLVGSGGRGPNTPPPAIAATPPASTPPPNSAVSLPELTVLSSSLREPIYWVGPRRGVTYELKTTGTEVFLRYFPPGVPVGDTRPFLTVGLRRLANAFAATRALARSPAAASRPTPKGGIAVYLRAKPTNVFVAYPNLGYQFEVISPNAAEALQLASGGALRPVPRSAPVPSLKPGVPVAVSVADLQALTIVLHQMIFWVGPQPGTTYELTQKGSQLFLRYLPHGVPVGTPQAELTVGTYKLPYQDTATAAGRPDARKVNAGIDGVAFYRPARPESVYLAFRGQRLQIEVYDPDPAATLRLATSGQLRSVG
jgi:hypothetical protein